MKKTAILSFFLTLSLCCFSQATGYEELTDSKPSDDLSVWEKCADLPALSWASADQRYAKRNVPRIASQRRWKGTAWRGERINAQALLWTKSPLSNATITVTDLTNGSSTISSDAIHAAFVRYVMTDELNKDGKNGCRSNNIAAEWDSSLVADVIDRPMIEHIDANTTQPLWVTVWVPSQTKSGVYKGTLTVSCEGQPAQSLQMEVNVLNRILPDPADWAFHLDLWQNPYSVARYHQVPLWSEAHFELMTPVMKMLANAGQKVITTSIMHKPWNGQTEDHFDSMIAKKKHLDGTWSYDYAVFDRWVEWMDGIGIDRLINCYTLIPWALTFDYYDQATGRILFLDTKPGETAYTDYWSSFLKDFSKHLREKGWFERTSIAMDERGLEAMQEAIKVIREADPEYKISLAGNYHEEIEAELHDLSIAYGHRYPSEMKAERDRSGKISTVYTCCAEARPNTYTFSPPAEAAWIGWHVMAEGYDGYLRWAYNSWTKDPLRDSRFRSWAAGDCYLVYPDARSSIRMERLIEGIQDFEKIRLLKEEFTAQRASGKLKRLDKLLAPFKAEKIDQSDPAASLRAARQELNRW